nr:MAG TPA: hypothetical protein [Caudoviricetes sp.]
MYLLVFLIDKTYQYIILQFTANYQLFHNYCNTCN